VEDLERDGKVGKEEGGDGVLGVEFANVSKSTWPTYIGPSFEVASTQTKE